MSMDLDELNKNQKEAVLWSEGPLLVLAGPGSGKTKVLTFRVARLVMENEDASVLALTFTNKAAVEMRDRVERLLGKRADRAHLSTFHSFAADILRQHGAHVGVRADFALLTEDSDRLAVLEPSATALRDEGYALPLDNRNLLSYLDQLFGDAYDGRSAVPGVGHAPEWVPRLFAEYCGELVRRNKMDWGAMLHFCRRLLQEQSEVGQAVRDSWTYVCIDEFQDTNKAQYDLLVLFVAKVAPNLFVVADEDQIVYQWNGASPERFQRLIEDYDMKLLQLPENYRCPPEIIAAANQLIQRNIRRSKNKAPLTTSRVSSGNKDLIRYRVLESPEKEVEFVAGEIVDRQMQPRDVVLLARTTKLVGQVVTGLKARGVDAYMAVRKNEFEAPPVRMVVNALRFAVARHDLEVLRRACVAWKDLTGRVLEVRDVEAAAGLQGGDFLRAWVEAASSTPGPAEANGLLERIRTLLVDRIEFQELVDWFLTEGHGEWARKEEKELADEIATWKELHDDIFRGKLSGRMTLSAYLQQMDLASKTPAPGPLAIRCLTIHGAKGLEFKHVYLAGMSQEVFPSFKALQKGPHSAELEEERRSCFVAITRVQETLTLTRARQYFGWAKGPSQFLGEMGIREP